jgi:hypothetical protein
MADSGEAARRAAQLDQPVRLITTTAQ